MLYITLKKMAEMLVKYGLPIAGVLAVAYGGKLLVDYVRGEDEDPEEFDDKLIHEADEGMIGQPDNFYDAEARKQAYNDLQDALEQSSSVQLVKAVPWRQLRGHREIILGLYKLYI